MKDTSILFVKALWDMILAICKFHITLIYALFRGIEWVNNFLIRWTEKSLNLFP